MKKLLCLGLVFCMALTACSSPAQPQATADSNVLPAGLKETDVTLNAGTEWELPGKLTSSAERSVSAAVLVHGSGPSDMNETVYDMTPFKDIAWGLAALGVDVLRYDKRTYVYGEKMAQDVNLTVKEEVTDDAIAAMDLLKEMGYEKVYLIGHSLGGMLALEIDRRSGGAFAGVVSLAGSPRTLVDIIADQNEAVIDQMTNEKEVEQARAAVDAELAKLEELGPMTDPATTIFNMPARYVSDLLSIDTYQLAAEYTKPILVLQGDRDFQVYPEVDYVQWQVALSENTNAKFVLYEGLNHMFAKAGSTNSIVDYMEYAPVDGKVIADIAEFIKD